MVPDESQRVSTIVKVFVSSENTKDPRVARIIDQLRRAPGIEVDHSPLNPLVGNDPRWQGWYGSECSKAIAAADCFLAIETRGYDCSTWMAHEFDVAWTLCRERGRPLLFLSKCVDLPLPAGFKRYEDAATILPVGPDAAVAAFLGRFG
jgi:hypothetical protein